jgi:hypothetical protein
MHEDRKRKWEEWYGDMVNSYQWLEVDHGGRDVVYVYGSAVLNLDEGAFCSDFVQVLGYADSQEEVGEAEQSEIVQLLRVRHGTDNVQFWIG